MSRAETARTVARLHRYPVKGLAAERLAEVALAPGRAIPLDRRFALARGAGAEDGAAAAWAPKSRFYTLMRHARLAALSAAIDAAGTMTLTRGGAVLARGGVGDAAGRAAIADAVRAHLGDEAADGVRLVEAAEPPLSDVPEPWISLINLASLRALEAAEGAPLDPLRFRANLYYDGGAAWEERDWPGRELAVGAARLRIEAPIGRCAATNVDPASAARDRNLPLALERAFGHVELGVYASVVGGGTVREGDRLRPA